jgi:hypothetical protein
MKKIPVFSINGFLESGKTQFILSTIRRDGFYNRGSTLLICCEQGEIEYDIEELKRYNTILVTIEDEEELTKENLDKIYKTYRTSRIVIENNFMWDNNNKKYPDYFDFAQIIIIIDGITFPIYYQNMRQKFTDIIKYSDVVAFTKLNDDRSSLQQFEAGLRITNSNCLYCLINEECISTMEAFEMKLPYNLEDKEIVINDNDFGIFYIDTFENRASYEGKIIELNTWVVKTDMLANNEFIAGRKVLNCCADDIQLFGFLVVDDLGKNLKHDSWIRLKATCHIEYNEQYQEEEVILYPIEITVIDKIENEILDLR